MIAAAVGIIQLADYGARQEDFVDATDQRLAKEAGFEAGPDWDAHKVKAAAKARQIALEEEARSKQREADKKARAEQEAKLKAEREARETAHAEAEAERLAQEQAAEEVRSEEMAKRQAAEKEAACRDDLKCWGEKHALYATTRCRPAIERLAKYDFEWTDDSWLETKFSRYRRGTLDKANVTYIGDKIKFQNGFGAWQHHIYTCEYDPITDTAVNAQAAPGRL